MAKAKHKIGSFIKYTENGTANGGEISAIVTRADGHSYMVDENEATVAENDIIAAYRQVKERKPKAVAKKNTKAGPSTRKPVIAAQQSDAAAF
jgi:hypothetical protein